MSLPWPEASAPSLNFLNLHHIFNFLAMRTPEIFHVTRRGHSDTGFSDIRNVLTVRTLEYPDFVFMLFQFSTL